MFLKMLFKGEAPAIYKDTSNLPLSREKSPSLYPAIYKDTSKSTIVYREKSPSMYPADLEVSLYTAGYNDGGFSL
jgi:hypothetical protein